MRADGIFDRLGTGQVAGEGHEGLLEIGSGDLDVAEGHAGRHQGPDGGVGVERVEDDI